MGNRLGWAAYAAVWLLMAVFAGCSSAPSETTKTLNDLNYDAGKQLAKNSDPAVAQVGMDVRDNSQVLADTFLGWPATRAMYTAAISAKVRADALKEFENSQPWYKKSFGWVVGVGLPALLSIGLFVGRAFPATAPVMAIAEPIVKTLMNIKQQAEAHPNDTLGLDAIQSNISALAQDPKAGSMVSSLLKKLHLDALIHAPEAPDMPVPPAAPAPAV